MNKSHAIVRCYADRSSLAHDLTAYLAQCIRAAVSERGICHMVIPGGRSPIPIFKQLVLENLPWDAIHLYPSDERCLPANDPLRNDRMIEENLLVKGRIAATNFHRIPSELGLAEGVLYFLKVLESIPCFDVVLVGAGPDGHIASLFPNHSSMSDCNDVVPVNNAPKPPPDRISIGFERLKMGYSRHVVVMGSEKRDIIDNSDNYKDTPLMRLNATIWYCE